MLGWGSRQKWVTERPRLSSPHRVLLLGLAGAGKTQILFQLLHWARLTLCDPKLREHLKQTLPSALREAAFSKELLLPPTSRIPLVAAIPIPEDTRNAQKQVILVDLPAPSSPMDPAWQHTFTEQLEQCHGVIVVIDSSDIVALPSVQMQLRKLNESAGDRLLPVLLLTHKRDLASAQSPQRVVYELEGASMLADHGGPWSVADSTCYDVNTLHAAVRWVVGQAEEADFLVPEEARRAVAMFQESNCMFALACQKDKSDHFETLFQSS